VIPIDLSGKTALVTGGGQGLGAATASLLRDAGADVVVNYLADAAGVNLQRAEETAADWGEHGAVIEADVRVAEAVKSMIEQTVARFGRLDIVVNNAGILRDRTAKNMKLEEWQAVIDSNLTGVFNVCQAAIGPLSDGGRIVSMSSVSAALGIYGQANYAAAKAGIVGLTKVLSRELASRRITVNAVAPGVVEAGMGLTIPEEFRAGMLKSVPLGRFAEPQEIAGVILFLCGDLASYITGQTIHVNGGWWGP
jgi:3-oxoacyl-[acyl-carrier protein] reductase